MEEKSQKQLVEKEAQKLHVGSSSVASEQANDRGKVVIEYPQQPETSSTFEALIISVEMNRNLELMSSVVEEHPAVSVPQPKKQRINQPPP